MAYAALNTVYCLSRVLHTAHSTRSLECLLFPYSVCTPVIIPFIVTVFQAGKDLGWEFTRREHGRVEVRRTNSSSNSSAGNVLSFRILATIPFDSSRKRMSVVVQCDGDEGEGAVVLSKGADNVMLERAAMGAGVSASISITGTVTHFTPLTNKPGHEVLRNHLSEFATDGLRTLLLAKRHLSPQDTQSFLEAWRKAENAVENREALRKEAAELVETGFTVLGATAIEDKLQDKGECCDVILLVYAMYTLLQM